MMMSMPRRAWRAALLLPVAALTLAACGGDGDGPALSAEAEAGRNTMRTNGCASCHGADGEAKTSMGEKLGIPPLKKTPKSKISKIISNGVAGTKMKAFKGKLTDDEIAAVTAFVKSL